MVRIFIHEALARITGQRVGTGLDQTRVAVHAVQKEIHHAQASRIGNQFPAAHKANLSGKALAAGFSSLFLILVHVVVVDDEIKCFQQEAAGPAGRIAHGVVGRWAGAIDDSFDQLARPVSGEALAAGIPALANRRLAPCRSQTLFEQSFVDIAFGIGLHAGPVLGVDQLDDSLVGAWRGFGYPAAIP